MLSSDATAGLLHSLTTGFPDHALNILLTSEEVDERERAVLLASLTTGAEPSDQARRFGDALRSLDAPRAIVNEAYRAAFYSSADWKSLSANPLYAYFAANRGGSPLDKWNHYFARYDEHLVRFRGTDVRLLEIGVYRGGGLDMFAHYLGPRAVLVGVDIDDAARLAVSGRYPVEVGDQADPAFLRDVVARHGPFDVVIDDGGHTMRQQIASIEVLFPFLADGGTYIVEDCHTSYWPDYADPDDPARTFVAWTKDRLDDLNAYHHSSELELVIPWQTDLAAVHAYDSLVVLDKAPHIAPFSEVSGTSDYLTLSRGSGIANIELMATREAAVRQAAEVEADAMRRLVDANHRAAEAEARASDLADASREELRLLRAELVSSNEHATSFRKELDALRDELADTNSKLAGSWGIIQEMRQSRSWQMTAPIRRVKSIIRRQ